jgi:hypothetical protein
MTETTAFFGTQPQNAAAPMRPSITMVEQRRVLNERVRLHVDHLSALVQTLKNLGIGDAAINDQVAEIFERYKADLLRDIARV